MSTPSSCLMAPEASLKDMYSITLRAIASVVTLAMEVARLTPQKGPIGTPQRSERYQRFLQSLSDPGDVPTTRPKEGNGEKSRAS